MPRRTLFFRFLDVPGQFVHIVQVERVGRSDNDRITFVSVSVLNWI